VKGTTGKKEEGTRWKEEEEGRRKEGSADKDDRRIGCDGG